MEVSAINIYPVKSLGGISLNDSKVEKRGLQFDRRWLLIDEENKFLTQREFPKMAVISIGVNANGLEVAAENFENLYVPFEVGGETKKVQIWQSICDAIPHKSQINEWFSKVLQTNCRLVFMPDQSERKINTKFLVNNEIVSFADGYPFLIISETSLADLNSRLEKQLTMDRFRPNIVVKNSEAFAEDKWQKIRIGNTIFRSTKPCARCVMTTINQAEGNFEGKEPLKTLATYRMAKDVFPNNLEELDLTAKSILFGQNLVAENFSERIKIGDKIEVIESKSF
jgi:hypothetical protein